MGDSGRFGELVDSLLVEVGIFNKLWMLDMCIKTLECIVFMGVPPVRVVYGL